MKKLHFLLFITLYSATLAIDAKTNQNVSVNNKATLQQEIYDHIIREWHTSKIDSSKICWLGSNGIIPPKPYFTVNSEHKLIYYWDSYFTNIGLLLIDSLAINAKNATDNLLWFVDTLGFVPNSNMTWGMNRSQPPFLAMMVDDVYRKYKDKKWLASAYETLKKEYHFWTDTSATAIENHPTAVPGLQRFSNHGTDEELATLYEHCYERGLVAYHPDSISHELKMKIATHFASEAATGMDFTPRFEGRCNDYIPVELNSNLYRYEILFAKMVKELGLKNEPNWTKAAKKRRKLMSNYLWNKERGMFMDYDYVNKRFSPVASVVCYYPLTVGLATRKQAARSVKNLPLFEFAYGVSVCEKSEQKHRYQWDFPAGWPPMFSQTIEGLNKYGYKTDAARIAQKYVNLLAKNFEQPLPIQYNSKKGELKTRIPGYIYEKYIVTTGEINDNEYNAREFLGWTAGVYIWCMEYLKKNTPKN
ncbi:MAG: trehalase [Paludibacteraceae bacterium]|nr:trehalase [Paludibacteraceae bacterium]